MFRKTWLLWNVVKYESLYCWLSMLVVVVVGSSCQFVYCVKLSILQFALSMLVIMIVVINISFFITIKSRSGVYLGTCGNNHQLFASEDDRDWPLLSRWCKEWIINTKLCWWQIRNNMQIVVVVLHIVVFSFSVRKYLLLILQLIVMV